MTSTTAMTDIRTGNIVKVNGAKELNKYIQQQTGFIQQIREEFLTDIQQPKATINTLPNFLSNDAWKYRAELCQNDHMRFINKLTGLPQSSTFLQNEAKFNEALEQIEDLRKMLVTNKQQKKTTIRKTRDIINLVKYREQQHEEQLRLMTMGDNDVILEAEDSNIVKALKSQIETMKQNHRTISRNLLQQVNSIIKTLRHHIVAVKISAEDHVGEIIHHAEKCRAFITKCFDYSVLLYCASAWWHQTQKDAMDDGYYHIEIETVNPEESIFNPNAAAPTEHNLRICVFRGNSINRNDIVHMYDYDQDLAQAIYTPESICEAEKIIRSFRIPGTVVATCDA